MKNQERINTDIVVEKNGNYTYIAIASPGTPRNVAAWQVIRYDKTSGVVGRYADGDDKFDNLATSLIVLEGLDYGD